jgi:hypothetical protein
MGIDLKSGGRRIGHNVRRAPVSKNPYVKLLEKLFRYCVVGAKTSPLLQLYAQVLV